MISMLAGAGAALFSILVLDGLWLGLLMRSFYEKKIGEQLAFNPPPGIAFYILYAIGIWFFVLNGTADNWKTIAWHGAFFGFIAYATYDLTNWATLKFWSAELVAVDLFWGMFITGVASIAGWAAMQYAA